VNWAFVTGPDGYKGALMHSIDIVNHGIINSLDFTERASDQPVCEKGLLIVRDLKAANTDGIGSGAMESSVKRLYTRLVE
jgi:hypothetical protein